jgi:predicted  nucleic acid-binding Zn-ribbon protein
MTQDDSSRLAELEQLYENAIKAHSDANHPANLELRRRKEEFDQAQQRASALERRVASLQDHGRAKDDLIAGLRSQLRDLDNKLAAEKAGRQQDRAETDAERTRLVNQATNAQARQKDAETRLAQRDSRVKLSAELEQLRSTQAGVRSRLQAASGAFEAEQIKLRNEFDRAQAREAAIEQELSGHESAQAA